MIQSFIKETVQDVLSKHQNIEDLVFILPGKRAGTFLGNELKQHFNRTTFAPEIFAIEDFVQELASLKLAGNLQLLFEFYEVYKELTPPDETEAFGSFSSWAQVILQDFNEIDRYLIDPSQIFTYLTSVKEIGHWTLDPEKTELQKNYLRFWNVLEKYYHGFRKKLFSNQTGYQGMIYREAIENIEYYQESVKHKKHIFMGFNALNNAEEIIIKEFLGNTDADIYWDIDEAFLNDSRHDAGLFIRKYKASWPYYRTNPFRINCNSFAGEKNLDVIGVPKNIGQSKYIGKILSELNPGQIKNTAVILGNESLLIPTLNSIPETIPTVNITSGLPLANTPVAGFFTSYLEMTEKHHGIQWYFRDVMNLISNPIAKVLLNDKNDNRVRKLNAFIADNNIVYLNRKHLESIFNSGIPEVINLLFAESGDSPVDQLISNCIAISLRLKEIYSRPFERNDLFLEYLYRFYELFNQIMVLNNQYGAITHLRTLKEVSRDLMISETVDFKGEPLEGLQIMGVLESRNLDFETVILSSVNEGVLPSGKTGNSFLPFEIKTAFGLPTYKEKDAVYAYHFFRLLQRAKNIYLLYNTEPDSLEGGEKSRFIMQLLMQNQSLHHINEIIASPKITNEKKELTQIQKDNGLLERLKEIAASGFSPSSLTNYIRNPLDFYYQSVLRIDEAKEVEENVAYNTFGTIVHNTLEDLYKPLTGMILGIEHIESMMQQSQSRINFHFEREYKGGDYSKGKNLISYHIVQLYVTNFLKYDLERLKKGHQIKIVEIESNMKVAVDIPEFDFPVLLRGKVDRIEEVDGQLRIIDYKTGKVNQSDVEIVEWEDLISDYKYSKAFQVLAYAYMMKKASDKFINSEAGIISFKNMGGGFLKFSKKDKSGRGAQKQHLISPEVLMEFENQLKILIKELFSIEIPMVEKEV